MADPNKFLHSWSMSKSNLLIRLYAFMIGKDALETINFCKLFWATLFSPIILLLRALAYPLELWARASAKRRLAHIEQSIAAGPKPKKDHKWVKAFLSAFTNGVDRLVAFLNRNSRKVYLVIIGLVLTGVGFVVDLSITHPHDFWTGIIVTGLIAGFIMIAMTIFFLVAFLEEEYDFWSRLFGAVGRFLGPKITKPLVALGAGLRTVGHFLLAGFYAVKYRTCPRVIISE